jgi:serine/threonine protein kinase/tetratricopeptide (TPR) repeat protein
VTETGTSSAGGPDDQRLIAALEECLAGIEGGLQPDRDLLRARYPDVAPDLLACLDALEFVHRTAPQPLLATGDVVAIAETPGRIGDYRLIREVGRGGMGIVYEAEQVSLARRVALKVLPFAAALEGIQLQRFHNEARVAALIHHPHVVPVFATGCERGVHYYAMQYIDGPSLQALINARRERAGVRPNGEQDFAETPNLGAIRTGSSGTRTAESVRRIHAVNFFAEAARVGAEAAEALEAAHQVGVIHRDVKPSNLLLDGSNNVWVADFGLAHVGGDVALTRTGNLIGTLRYMSPEQALGRPGLVDHRTDVYSLGATLYELITLQPAFPDSDRERLLWRIANEDPQPPRSICPTVPRPLEAVVLKAMAKDPCDRYACAGELCADLRRFLEGQPVNARPPSRLRRFRRWALKHSGLVLTVATAASTLLAVVTAAAIVVARQRNLAEERGQLARRAVDEMYTEVAERWLARTPHLELVQQQFLEKARRFYEEFALDAGADPAARQEAARALRRVGDIDRRLGRLTEAEAAYDEAAAGLAVLCKEQPDDERTLEESALLCTGRGCLFLATSRLEQAEREFRRALDCYKNLSARATSRRYALGCAGCEVNLGAVLATIGRAKEAVDVYSQALNALEGLSRQLPNDAEALYALAGCLNDAGNLLASTRPAEAEAHYKRSLAIEDRLLASAPGEPAYRHARASTGSALATLFVGSDRLAMARSTALKALKLREQLAADFPDTPVYREEIATGRLLLGDILAVSGRPGDAGSWYKAAAASYDRLADALQTSPECRRCRAETLSRLAGLSIGAGRPAVAEAYYRAALSALRADHVRDRLTCQDDARAWGGLGSTLAVAGRPADAEMAYATAVAQWERLQTEALADDSDRWGLATALCQHAMHQQSTGRTGRAEAAYHRVIAITESLALERPGVSGYRLVLATAFLNRGLLLRATGRAIDAEADYRRAFAISNALASEHADVPDYRRLLASCLASSGRLQDAGSEAERALTRAATIARELVVSPARTLADERILADALQGLAEAHDRAGRSDGATTAWRQLLRQRQRLVAEYPEVPSHRHELAWLLANGPIESVRDARRALTEARTALALSPQDPAGWLAFGAAAYRCGAWPGAADALNRYVRIRGGGGSPAGFLLAMTRWQQGDRRSAATAFEEADSWYNTNQRGEPDLYRLREEAAFLLGSSVRR